MELKITDPVFIERTNYNVFERFLLKLIREERYSEAVDLLESAAGKADAPAGLWSALGLASG